MLLIQGKTWKTRFVIFMFRATCPQAYSVFKNVLAVARLVSYAGVIWVVKQRLRGKVLQANLSEGTLGTRGTHATLS